MRKVKMMMACAAVMMLGVGSQVSAMDMGVVVIAGPEDTAEPEPVSLDDIKLQAEVTIDGYAILRPTEFKYEEYIGVYPEGREYPSDDTDYISYSGTEADYALFRMDITNLKNQDMDFLAECDVKVIYDEAYEYGGWYAQYNYDNEVGSGRWYEDCPYIGEQNTNYVIVPADQFAIKPMYVGHYVFGCTLPNAVISSDKPLAMVVTLGGNEITYNIR